MNTPSQCQNKADYDDLVFDPSVPGENVSVFDHAWPFPGGCDDDLYDDLDTTGETS